MNEYIDRIKHIDKMLLLLLGVFISFILCLYFSANNLIYKKLKIEHDKITEFIDNQNIFNAYLEQKKDLYWEFNKKLFELSGEKGKDVFLFMGVFAFYDLWGWDEERLDNRKNFQYVLENFFLEDIGYWTTKPDEFYNKFNGIKDISAFNMEKRLKKYVPDTAVVDNFLAQNFIIKMSFLKDMIQKYEIRAQESIIPYHIINPKEETPFADFLNDKQRNTFSIKTFFYLKGFGDFFTRNIYFNSICKAVYEKYVKDKYKIYDNNIFASSNVLLYSSYIDKIKRKREILENNLKNLSYNQSQINIGYSIINIDITLLYKWAFWLLLLLSWFINNGLLYRKKITDLLNKQNTLNTNISQQEFPSFLYISVFPFKSKSIKIAILFLIIIIIGFLSTGALTYTYYDIIYPNKTIPILSFFVIVPIVSTIILSFRSKFCMYGIKRKV